MYKLKNNNAFRETIKEKNKVKIFKMHRRKHYRKSQGHRQSYTEIKIDKIAVK